MYPLRRMRVILCIRRQSIQELLPILASGSLEAMFVRVKVSVFVAYD